MAVRCLTTILCGALILLCAGCAHELTIADFDTTYSGRSDTSLRGLSVAIVNSTRFEESAVMADKLRDALRRLGGYRVSTFKENKLDSTDYDVVISFSSPVLKGDGNWSNFFVCFPGYLVFAHAWAGYGYNAKFKFNCEIAAMDGSRLGNVSCSHDLDMRYARNQTCSGNIFGFCIFFPPFMVFPVINGLVQMGYDVGATTALYEKTFPAMANELAEQVIRKINAADWVESGTEKENGSYAY